MTRMMILAGLALSVAGCAQLVDSIRPDRPAAPAPTAPVAASGATIEGAATAIAPETTAPPPPSAARTAEALDTTTAEQRAAAAAPPPATNRTLGTTVASLGSPTEPGLWLKTPLVDAQTQGRVTNPATGKSSQVTLIPLDGPATAGSQMSLAAMRLIDASLTDLTEVEVSLDG